MKSFLEKMSFFFPRIYKKMNLLVVLALFILAAAARKIVYPGLEEFQGYCC